MELTHVEAFYGKIRALKGIDLNVEQGEIVTLIGANGAGKSTTLKAISGLMKLGPEAKITFDGEDITHLPPHEIAARGIAHVPEGRGIFAENTVLENLRMGAYLSRSKGPHAGAAGDLARSLSAPARAAAAAGRDALRRGSSRC